MAHGGRAGSRLAHFAEEEVNFGCLLIAFFLDCRVSWRAAFTALALEGSAPAIAFDVHLEDGRVMNETVDSGQRHSLIWKDLPPVTEGLIGGDQHRPPLVA